ncbi:MAG TPA: cupin domain-containing protein [Verrucomicrobiae bacterium]|nr:cupin domain-containing protein [Verrucomicrobiae bacterium]
MHDRITPQTAVAKLATAGGQRWVTLLKHGNIELEYYAPQEVDPQQPHTRDEVYFIVAGRATFVMNGERREVSPGEVLLAPCGVPHRFEQISVDFATWAIFVTSGG